jgi:hypothetical protein
MQPATVPAQLPELKKEPGSMDWIKYKWLKICIFFYYINIYLSFSVLIGLVETDFEDFSSDEEEVYE